MQGLILAARMAAQGVSVVNVVMHPARLMSLQDQIVSAAESVLERFSIGQG